MISISAFKDKKLFIVLNGLVFYGGATKSIFNYYRYSLNKGDKVELIDLQSYKGVIKFILAAFLSSPITVNGLSAMNSWIVLFVCIFRSDIIFYCHEAEYSFNAFKKRAPLKAKVMEWILPKLTIACVSAWQMDYISSAFNVKNATVVYENVDYDTFNLDASKVNIVMLGYIMERKGVDLFSLVADIANKTDPDFKFTWIGSGQASDLYFSPNVDWIGEVLKPDTLLQQSDLLFHSAVDDPFPLACLEALAYKKKCVVYKNTGTAEVIRDISGCAVYEEYTAESAFAAIRKALASDLDVHKLEYIQKDISSVASFASRFDALLNK